VSIKLMILMLKELQFKLN